MQGCCFLTLLVCSLTTLGLVGPQLIYPSPTSQHGPQGTVKVINASEEPNDLILTSSQACLTLHTLFDHKAVHMAGQPYLLSTHNLTTCSLTSPDAQPPTTVRSKYRPLSML